MDGIAKWHEEKATSWISLPGRVSRIYFFNSCEYRGRTKHAKKEGIGIRPNTWRVMASIPSKSANRCGRCLVCQKYRVKLPPGMIKLAPFHIKYILHAWIITVLIGSSFNSVSASSCSSLVKWSNGLELLVAISSTLSRRQNSGFKIAW